MAPFNLNSISGTIAYNLIFLLIGMGFGAALELSGFGDTRKLAGQFYFRDMTVLKVMFTAIIVAATLIFLSSALGLLDFPKLWVNPTYMWPGIVGGLIMGVGFIVGGFCPGTSLVAAATLKIDGIVFLLGVLTGVFAFGESVQSFDGFFHSSFMGRFILPELLGLPTGVTLILLILMAFAMFYCAEISEAYFGRKDPGQAVSFMPRSRGKAIAGASLLSLAVVAAIVGQPTAQDRWSRIAAAGEKQITDRDVFVHPREVVDLKKDTTLRVSILDLRGESDYNLFHIAGSTRFDPASASDPAAVKPLIADPDNTIHFLVSNGDETSAKAWRLLKAQGVMNLYVIDGGINHWLDVFTPPACVAEKTKAAPAGEKMGYRFMMAVGDRIPQAHPDYPGKDPLPSCAIVAAKAEAPHAAAPDYVKKVKLQKKAVAKGGCG